MKLLLSVCSRRVFPIAIFRLASQQHRKVRATLALVCVKVLCLFNFVGHWTLLSMPRNRFQCHKKNTRKFLMYSNLIHLISLACFMTFLLYLIAFSNYFRECGAFPWWWTCPKSAKWRCSAPKVAWASKSSLIYPLMASFSAKDISPIRLAGRKWSFCFSSFISSFVFPLSVDL